MKPTRILPLLVPTLVVGLGGAAFAVPYDQDGRETARSNIAGIYAAIVGNGFSPQSGSCVIYAVLTFDPTSKHQVEAGLTRGDNATIDGTCPGGHTYVERMLGEGEFRCVPGNTFSNGASYGSTITGNSSTSNTFTGAINGATLDQSGFALTDSISGYAWGEVFGGSTCPSPSQAHFYQWQRYDTNSGWSYVSASTRYWGYENYPDSPCWATVTAPEAGGDFDVN